MGGLPMPKFFGPLFRSAFLVNKNSLFSKNFQLKKPSGLKKKNWTQSVVRVKNIQYYFLFIVLLSFLYWVGLESTLSSIYYTWLKRFVRKFGKSFINSAWKCGTAFFLCRTFWERVKVQVMEGSHVRKKIFWALVDKPLPAIDSTVVNRVPIYWRPGYL